MPSSCVQVVSLLSALSAPNSKRLFKDSPTLCVTSSSEQVPGVSAANMWLMNDHIYAQLWFIVCDVNFVGALY